jgi:iron complex outermembrane recepter protein
MTWLLNDRNQLYGSYAIANREPVRDDFVDFPGNTPEPEKLRNIEAGYRNTGKKHFFNANFYLMRYKNQFVNTGQLNDVGAPIRTNAGESYRMGLELESSVSMLDLFRWNVNVTLSENRIKSYTEVLEDYGENFDEFNIVRNVYNDTPISFSPATIVGSQLAFQPFTGAEIAWMTKYVGKQYLDNTGNKNRTIRSYIVNDIRLSYNWKPAFAETITFSLLINNIFDEEYESNGYTWGYLGGTTEYREKYYYPQAGTNFLAMISARI